MDRRWATEFKGTDGAQYAGPILLADCEDAAEALLTCIQGPSGQRIDLLGELAMIIPNGETTDLHVRRFQ